MWTAIEFRSSFLLDRVQCALQGARLFFIIRDEFAREISRRLDHTSVLLSGCELRNGKLGIYLTFHSGILKKCREKNTKVIKGEGS